MTMEQSELFEKPGNTHKPRVYYYRCGQGFVLRDEWRYFGFELVETKANMRKKAAGKRKAPWRNRRKPEK